MKKYIITVLLLLSIIFLQGCSTKTMTNTLFDINSEYDNDGAQNSIKQSRIMTVNPLASIEEVGQICFLDPKRGSETAIYLDINATAKKIVKNYETNTSRDELMNIRDGLLNLDRETVALVAKNIELLNYKIYKNSNDYNKTKDNNDTDDKINTLENSITKLTNDLNITYGNLIKDLNQSNAIIVRWSKEREKSFIGKIGEFFNLNRTSKKSLSGFILASGLKTERLIINDKYIETIDGNISEFFKPTTGVITYTVSAKDIVFVNKSDISTMFGIDLDVKYDDFIGNSSQILKKINELKLHIAASSVENGLSGGYLSEPVVTKENISLNNSIDKCTKEDDKKDKRENVFFSVYTKLGELNRLFK